MSEIFGAINLKNKITIASSMAAFAILLATAIGVLTFAMADTHKHMYDYSLEMGEDGSFDLVGVCKVDNCETPYYRESDLSGVKLLSADSPTCSKEGNRDYAYTHNGVTVKYTEKLSKVAHLYDYERVTQDGVICLNGSCTVCKETVFVNNIEEIRLDSVVEGTCFSPRQETYVYTVEGQEYSFVTLVDEDIPHTLNGVAANSFENDDGKYTIGTPGVKLFINDKLACGAVTDGFYICEICKQINAITVVRPDHKFLYNEKNLTEPTVDTEGLATLVCHNTECTETVKVVIPRIEIGKTAFIVSEATELRPLIVSYTFESLEHGFTIVKEYEIGEKLSHIYEYKLWLNEKIGKFEVLGICDQPGCMAKEVCIEKDVPAVFVKDTSTCQVPGIVIWSYEYKGETLIFDPPSLVPAPHSYIYDQNKAMHPTLDEAGLIELHCSSDGCDHAILVTLPKIVVGENTIFVEETAIGGNLYLYTYKYEGCTIVLNMVLDYKNP